MRKAEALTERIQTEARFHLKERNSRIQVQPRDTGSEDGNSLAEICAVTMHGIAHAAQHEGHITIGLLAAHLDTVVHGVDFTDLLKYSRVKTHFQGDVVLDGRGVARVGHFDRWV